MGKNRPIVVATLGYIIGIIWGLYFKINIILFYILMLIVLMIAKITKKKEKTKFKFISIQKILRYLKLIFDFKSAIIIIIFSSISNFIVINSNNKYENLYSHLERVQITAKIVNNGTPKDYKTTYKIKVESLNGNSKYKGTYLYLDVKKQNLKYGDYINLEGIFTKPSKATNYQGFDYSKYLRIQKVYGTVKVENIQILQHNTNNILFTVSNNIFLRIKQTVQENLSEENANLLLGILFGYKEELPEEMQENFKQSNISHVLAVSGLHVSYIILVITKILEKAQGKRLSKIIVIFFIISYMFITNFSPSVVRAGLMGIIAIIAKLTYNKNDIRTSICISLLIILIYNPYLITSAGVLLSYGGTIGIILFQKNISELFQKVIVKSKLYQYKIGSKLVNLIDYIQDTLTVSFSAQLFIAPIIAKMFNTFSLSFFITNFFVSIVIGPIIILGFLFILSSFLFSEKFPFLVILIKEPIERILDILIFISKMGSALPFNQIYIATPEIWQLAIYYVIIILLNVMFRIYNKRKLTVFEKRLLNWINLIKHLIRKNNKKVISIITCGVIVVSSFFILPKDFKIHFIDVGQGDSTLIITPENKTILIDGGGSEYYDVGKNTLLPYLLDRKITEIDYMIISHFDTDHVRSAYLLC